MAAVSPRQRAERWLILQDWEYLQAFMDASRPPPDVAELEGYRGRDGWLVAQERSEGTTVPR